MARFPQSVPITREREEWVRPSELVRELFARDTELLVQSTNPVIFERVELPR